MPAPSKSYTSIADAAVDPDSPVDTALMTALRDNSVNAQEQLSFGFTPAQAHNHDGTNSALVVSIANGAVSSSAKFAAAVVNQAAMGSAAVGQAQLKTTTASGSLNDLSSGSTAIQTSAAGDYGFAHSSGYTDNAATALAAGTFWGRATYDLVNGFGWVPEVVGNTTLSPSSFISLAASGHQANWSQRYVQSSPPYDLGDGICGGFIYVEIDSLGNILQVWIAEDPPWANNGPTSLVPDFIGADGKHYQRVPQVIEEFGTIALARQTGGLTDAQIVTRLATDSFVPREITQAVKQADMPLLPHPFVKLAKATSTIVLLDPMSDLCANLTGLNLLQATGKDSVHDLLYSGYLKIDNTRLSRSGPPGVQVLAATWKVT